MERSKITPEQKLQSVKNVLEKNSSLRKEARQYQVHHSSVEKWVLIYQMFGAEGFSPKHRQRYSDAVKRKAVEAYLTSDSSLLDICRKFEVRTISQIQFWIEDYKNKRGDDEGGRRK